MTEVLASIAARTFEALARAFPVMTASDHFYTFPRAEAAVEHAERIETLTPREVEAALSETAGLLAELESVETTAALGPAEAADAAMLRTCQRIFLRDYGERRVWQCDAVLYLKIAMAAIEMGPPARWRDLPVLFRAAGRSLHTVSRPNGEIALDMLAALAGIIRALPALPDEAARATLAALADFEAHLRADLLPRSEENVSIGEAGYADRLRLDHDLDYSPDEVARIGDSIVGETTAGLEREARSAGVSDWRALAAAAREAFGSPPNLFGLYRREVAAARDFLRANDLLSLPADLEPLEVRPASPALKPVKSVAGCNFVVGDQSGSFTVNADEPTEHWGYRLIVAHEAFPGHHLQGAIRRRSPSSIRRQIERPIFYEGWAHYCEGWMVEAGYASRPAERVACLADRLFRALRLQIDHGLACRTMELAGAEAKLVEAGLTPARARHEARRYALIPGFPTAYALGRHELIRLRDRYGARLSGKTFHDTILQSGELPFRFLDQALADAVDS